MFIFEKCQFLLRRIKYDFLSFKGDWQMKALFETSRLRKELLRDEMINAKLYDNQSFQYILDREIQRRIKNRNNLTVDPKK